MSDCILDKGFLTEETLTINAVLNISKFKKLTETEPQPFKMFCYI